MTPAMLVQPFDQSFNSVYYPQYNTNYTGNEQDPYYYLGYPQMDPNEDFRASFYNPFEIKHRRRTSRAQLKVLERSFEENPKPNATVRRILAQQLDMTPRGVQIWFQNRRAKAKLQKRKSGEEEDSQQQDQPQSQNNSPNLFNQFFANLKSWNNDARFVATSAAASCLLDSSSNMIDNNLPEVKIEDEWLNMPIHPLAPVIEDGENLDNSTTMNAEDWRRKSCPALSDYQHGQDQKTAILSWPSHNPLSYPVSIN